MKPNQSEHYSDRENCINGQAPPKDVTNEGTYQIILQDPKEIQTIKNLMK